jgi:hypothetical protein
MLMQANSCLDRVTLPKDQQVAGLQPAFNKQMKPGRRGNAPAGRASATNNIVRLLNAGFPLQNLRALSGRHNGCSLFLFLPVFAAFFTLVFLINQSLLFV